MNLSTLVFAFCSILAPGSSTHPELVGELGSVRFLQTASVDAVAFEVSTGRAASCASGGELVLWDEADGHRLGAVQLGISRAVSLAFLTPDRLLVGDAFDQLHVVEWHADKGALRVADLFGPGLGDLAGLGGGFALAPDRRWLALWGVTGAGGELMLADLSVDAKQARARRVLALEGFRADGVAWSRDGALLAVMATNARKVIGRAGTQAQDSSRVFVFNARSGEQVARLVSSDDLLESIAFGPREGAHGGLLVAGGRAGLHLWDLAGGRELSRFGKLGAVQQLVVSSDGRQLVALAKSGQFEAWQLSLDAEPEFVEQRDVGRGVAMVALEPEHLLAAQGRRVRRWRLDDWSLEPHVVGQSGLLAALDARSGRVLSIGLDGSVLVWDEATGEGQALAAAAVGLVFGGGLSPDGERLVTCGQDASMRMWDLTPGESFGRELGVMEGRTAAGFTAAAFSPRGDILAGVSADGILWIRKADDLSLVRTFEGLEGLQFKLAFSGDGGRLAVGSSGVRVWDTSSWELLCEVKQLKSPVTALAFAPGGRELAVGLARKMVSVVEVASGKLRATSEPLPARVSALAYFDGRLAVASARLAGILLLDGALKDDGFLASPEGLDIAVLARSGERLFAGDQRGRIQIWK